MIMKQTDDLYKQWLGTVKSNPPMIGDPKVLSEAIMRRVKEQSSKARLAHWKLYGWLSGIAAAFLIIICLNTVFSTPNISRREDVFSAGNSTKNLPPNWDNMSELQKAEAVYSNYLKRQKTRQQRTRLLNQ